MPAESKIPGTLAEHGPVEWWLSCDFVPWKIDMRIDSFLIPQLDTTVVIPPPDLGCVNKALTVRVVTLWGCMLSVPVYSVKTSFFTNTASSWNGSFLILCQFNVFLCHFHKGHCGFQCFPPHQVQFSASCQQN